MYSSAKRLIPVGRVCLRYVQEPVRTQSRNVWDWRPSTFRSIARDFDRHLERFERDFFQNSPLRILEPRILPIEGAERKNHTYRVNIDISGFKPEDIKISLKDSVLTVQAKSDTTAADGSRFQQQILREFALPKGIDESTLTSLLHNDGILSIEANLTAPETPKEIPIDGVKK